MASTAKQAMNGLQQPLKMPPVKKRWRFTHTMGSGDC
jgi:hypothetical protein